MSQALLLAVLLAAPARAATSQPLANLAIQDSDSESVSNRLRGLAEELGGVEALRELGHIVKPVSFTALLLPITRYAEFEKEVRRLWPQAVLEREGLGTAEAEAVAARERAKLTEAVEELGRFEGQLPVLSGFLQLRLEARSADAGDWLRVVCAVVEDRVVPSELLIQAKGSGLRRAKVTPPASGSAAALSADSAAAAKELRGLLGGSGPRAMRDLARRQRELEAEAKDFSGFLKERPALRAVLADARRTLRARLKSPAAAKAP